MRESYSLSVPKEKSNHWYVEIAEALPELLPLGVR